MQLYTGLPIITNKMPAAERKGVPHHLLGCIGLNEPTWDVGTFVSNALKTIQDIQNRGKIPVLVGGTHYYTQALLFRQSIVDEKNVDESGAGIEDFPILRQPTDVILAKLREVDPTMANRWHPHDRRKIQGSLEIWLRTGKTASQTYDQQKDGVSTPSTPTANHDSMIEPIANNLRFSTLVFWVHADRKALHTRLDSRVLNMVESGLLEEVKTLDNLLDSRQANDEPVDQTRGIWVSIGYKEFDKWAIASRSADTKAEEMQRLKFSGVERTQAATRQYSNRQMRWIRIKLLNALHRAGRSNHTFLLDGTDAPLFDQNVVQPAFDITSCFLRGEHLPEATSLSVAASENLVLKSEDLRQRPDLWVRQVCEACGKTAVTADQWQTHINSRRHKKVIAAQRKKAVQHQKSSNHISP